ncbi:hypothetical protein JAAARDRAFT_70749 [Jaapia argillacea MUCL 33604]|uniref:Microbial-type PARG catalytic domain-containing protein n=1 Tax=Jaapia argillacea MUCL 33604 TaxID=933084 RepID=A0A067PNX8_9AGAM|nr:hypothetical protein JAAARDRAFT_70749 [Jaapia argillacea MUCL 33604]
MLSQGKGDRRAALKEIAHSTLHAIEKGVISTQGTTHDITERVRHSNKSTRFYSVTSQLSTWRTSTLPSLTATPTEISFLEVSTIDGVRLLSDIYKTNSPNNAKSGVLNFASAKKVGGGFRSGAQSQEESIARSSTLSSSLMTGTAQQFYTLHNRDPEGGYYSHSMIYSPSVLIFRDDAGNWIEPLEVDILTSPAVNAGEVRRVARSGHTEALEEEAKIEEVMKERMGRILFLFQQQGTQNLVLGSFGTGAFKNKVSMVARIWAELLVVEGARFKNVFERVVFAILGKPTFDEFHSSFNELAVPKESEHEGPYSIYLAVPPSAPTPD